MNELDIACIRAILRRKDDFANKEILINDWLNGCEYNNNKQNPAGFIKLTLMDEEDNWYVNASNNIGEILESDGGVLVSTMTGTQEFVKESIQEIFSKINEAIK